MHLDNLDLNLLVALDALVRRRSVTSAAEELHITQSALSSALKRARRHFGDELFYYDGQNMVPTAFGAELAKRIPDIIVELRSLSRMRSNATLAEVNRQFTMIASDYVSAVFVSALSRRLAESAPGISLSVVPFTMEAMGQFQRGVLDFLIAPEFALRAGFIATPLFSDSFRCVLCRSNPHLAGGFDADAYFGSPHVVTNFFLEDGKSHFERWIYLQGHPIRVAASLPSFVVLPHYIAGTPNVATIHDRLALQFQTTPDLVFVEPPVAIPALQEYLVTTRKHEHDPEARMLAAVMLDVAAMLPPPVLAPA